MSLARIPIDTRSKALYRKESIQMRKKILFLIASTVLVCSAAQSSRSDLCTTPLPPHSTVACRTLGEWSALWWAWAFSFPVNDNPLLDTTGEKAKFGDVGPVFFLAGAYNASGNITRKAILPPGKFIFFPVVNLVNDNVGVSPRQTIDELAAALAGAISSLADLHASVDGVPVDDLQQHREMSPVFSYTLQSTDNLQQVQNNIPDAQGTIFPVLADGFYLMLRPLSPGHHVISFGGTLLSVTFNVTYDITVEETAQPQPAVLIPGPTVLSGCAAKEHEK
jgi:hypothetical protein